MCSKVRMFFTHAMHKQRALRAKMGQKIEIAQNPMKVRDME